MTADPVLAVDRLGVTVLPTDRTQAIPIVEDLSFTIRAGEVLGIAGESGAGKSMAAAALIGLLPSTVRRSAGTITLNGRRIDGLPERDWRRLRGRVIGLVPQDASASLNPLETVGRHMVETLLAHKSMPRRQAEAGARELLAAAAFSDPTGLMPAYPHELSGGMRQRVAIALALAPKPALLIADEPTTALDVSIQAQALGALRHACQDHGAAILLISHDLAVMAETADRLIVVYAGRAVETGPALAVLGSPAHPYTAALIASFPDLRTRRHRLPHIHGTMPRSDARPPGCAFHPRCPKAMPACRMERPPIMNLGVRQVACWLFEDDGAALSLEDRAPSAPEEG